MGLILTWTLQLAMLLPFTMKVLADVESNMTAILRILDYIENNPQERSWNEPKVKDKEWPKVGVLQAKNITFKYGEKLPEIIKGIDFEFKPNEKIGVVGRTGSGKSTLTLGIMRILELSKN